MNASQPSKWEQFKQWHNSTRPSPTQKWEKFKADHQKRRNTFVPPAPEYSTPRPQRTIIDGQLPRGYKPKTSRRSKSNPLKKVSAGIPKPTL